MRAPSLDFSHQRSQFLLFHSMKQTGLEKTSLSMPNPEIILQSLTDSSVGKLR